jgi:CheY-like chemotaxis protein
VKGKIFLFAGVRDGELSFAAKLPQSRRAALAQPFAAPTGYGLGKAGWVTCTFQAGKSPPIDVLLGYIEESYRAIAPKKLVAQLDAAPAPAAAPRRARAARVKKVARRVALVAYDPLRIERATRGFGERGLAVEVLRDAAAARARLGQKLDGIIIDVGTRQAEGLALAAEIDASDAPIMIFLVGLRDGAARKKAQSAATSADLFREPPGDPAVVAAVLDTLAHY